MQLVELIWLDAWADTDSFSSAHGISLTHKPMVVKTLGWLIKDDEIGVSVANERSMDNDTETFRGRTFVPRAMIQSITPFNLSRPRKPPSRPKLASVSSEADSP